MYETKDICEINSECVQLCMTALILAVLQYHMVKDKDLILTMKTDNRWLSVIQQYSTNRYDFSNWRGPIKHDSLWHTLHLLGLF